MARIKIYFQGVTAANETLKRALSELSGIENELLAIQRSISPAIRSRNQIAEKLHNCAKMSQRVHADGTKLLSTVENGLRQYQITESQLFRTMPRDERERN